MNEVNLKKLLAVLPTVYNRKDKTLSCLSQLYKQFTPNGYEIEVFLTDDGCTDGTPEAIKEKFPQVHIIHGDGNLFWNRGMYTAWEAASSAKDFDYYLWLNDDTVLFDDAVYKLLVCSEDHNDKAIIVGATVDTNTRTKITYGGRIKGKVPTPNGIAIEVEHFNGNIVLVPQSVFKILGNLDWYFKHSKGDFDYGMRAKVKGIRSYQVGDVLGECEEHKTLDMWCNPDIPLQKRWSMLHRPNGMPPKETFYLERKYDGFLIASIHFFTVYLRCLFPQIWRLKSHE